MKKGFTLIELLVVVLIIGILSAIALPQYTTAVEKARASEAVTLMGTLRYAAERYHLQTGQWPNTDMTVLDVEMPNATTTQAQTKNFTITATGSTGSTYVITAARRDGGALYKLYTAVDTSGNAIRCCGTTAPTTATACNQTDPAANILTMCKAITSGNYKNGKW